MGRVSGLQGGDSGLWVVLEGPSKRDTGLEIGTMQPRKGQLSPAWGHPSLHLMAGPPFLPDWPLEKRRCVRTKVPANCCGPHAQSQEPPAGFHGGVKWALSRKGCCWGHSTACPPRACLPGSPHTTRWQDGREAGAPVAQRVTQPELRASEWQNVACQIKLGASKLKIHIYFNRSGCSERDEREGR